MSALAATLIFLLPLLIVLVLMAFVMWRENSRRVQDKPYRWQDNEAIARAQRVDEVRRRIQEQKWSDTMPTQFNSGA